MATITITIPATCAPGATVNITLQNDGGEYGGASWTIFPSDGAAGGSFNVSSVEIGDISSGGPQSATIQYTAPVVPQTVTFTFYALPDEYNLTFGGGDCAGVFSLPRMAADLWESSDGWSYYAGILNTGTAWRLSLECWSTSVTDIYDAPLAANPNRPPAGVGNWTIIQNQTGNDFESIGTTEIDLGYSPSASLVVGQSNTGGGFLAVFE